MKFFLISALSLIAGVFGEPVATDIPQVQIEESHFPNVSTLLPDLLHAIQGQTSAIGKLILSKARWSTSSSPRRHPGPIVGDTADKVAGLIGIHLHNITSVLHDARGVLGSLTNDTTLVDEDGLPCDVTCIVDKTKGLVKHVGNTAHKSLLKVGLHALSKTVSPFFMALSAIVLTLNAIVGGALAAIAALVNGIGLSIVAGIAYLGHLVSEKEKQRAGGPGGNVTHSIGHLIGEVLGHKLANLDL